ncbi:hypothetical protein, partial [Mycobacterium avium]
PAYCHRAGTLTVGLSRSRRGWLSPTAVAVTVRHVWDCSAQTRLRDSWPAVPVAATIGTAVHESR